MLGDRLKAERERRGLTQPGLAAIAGAAKRTVIDWEKGVSSPTGVQLEAMFKAGLDVQYIVTGTPSTQTLTRDEVELLEAFRAAPLAVKAAALGALQGGSAVPKTKHVVHGSVGQSVTGDVINQKGVKIEVGTGSASGRARKR